MTKPPPNGAPAGHSLRASVGSAPNGLVGDSQKSMDSFLALAAGVVAERWRNAPSYWGPIEPKRPSTDVPCTTSSRSCGSQKRQ